MTKQSDVPHVLLARMYSWRGSIGLTVSTLSIVIVFTFRTSVEEPRPLVRLARPFVAPSGWSGSSFFACAFSSRFLSLEEIPSSPAMCSASECT
uniref:Uncharacterized protein n=1 Tax=Rhipicephalus zambeziensis TaxID=60191 RepID=A0A224YAQ3_9ACAR